MMKLSMGIYDSPQTQQQPFFELDWRRSNIVVFGGPMSGKTTFIKTLLVRLHEDPDRLPREDVYIIDFGGNLGEYAQLSGVCACFDNSNEENIKRVFKTLERRLEDNAAQLHGSNYLAAQEKQPEACPAHLTLILENVNAFLSDDRYAAYQDRLLKLCRDGLSRGLCVVMTANETTGMSRLIANCGQKVAFEMPADSYHEIFGTKVSKPMRAPGRCVVNIGSAVFECQCFLPFAQEEKEFGPLLARERGRRNENRMQAFPDVLTRENLSAYCKPEELSAQDADSVLVGLDYDEHKPVRVNIRQSRAIAIYGKKKFGKSNLLTNLLDGIRALRPDARFVFFDDGRKELEPLCSAREGAPTVSEVYFKDVSLLRTYLEENGYGGLRGGKVFPVDAGTPFTVFVLQGKTLYQGAGDARHLMERWFPVMIGNADAMEYLFLFTDVKSIPDPGLRDVFHHVISLAFLLDNIGEFVAEKGSGNKSVFGEMDARELKAEFAKCALGDGFVYDVEKDDMPIKLKFIKA